MGYLRMSKFEPLPNFVQVQITRAEFLDPPPEHYGERVVWTDGTLHGWPEDDNEFVTVLRREHWRDTTR